MMKPRLGKGRNSRCALRRKKQIPCRSSSRTCLKQRRSTCFAVSELTSKHRENLMKVNSMTENPKYGRRHFIRTASLALAAVPEVFCSTAQLTRASSGPDTSFTTLKQVDAGLLNVGYAEAGPVNGSPVILLHGWPYDIHTYADVAPLLAAQGYRVLIPFLRGYGSTLFLSEATVRNGQPAALALDVIALMDVLKIESAIIGGCDWGARTANIIAALWPERCKALVSVSGYLIGSPEVNKGPLPPKAELDWWYQYYFATERGRAGYEKYRREFSKLIWQLASPRWNFDDATFDRSAAAFDNPD